MLLRVGLVLCLGLLVAPFGVSGAERARYDNYHAYKVSASTEAELAVLKQFEETSDSVLFLNGVHNVDEIINVVVAPHKVPDFLQVLGKHEISYELFSENIQSELESDELEVAPRDASYSWSKYFTLEDTYKWLQSLAVEYPQKVSVIEGGKTYEGRSILGVKVSPTTNAASKPNIFIEAGIHAREWIAPATATYIINQLLTSQNAAIRNLGENYNWYIFPHANPDGYVYTHTTDRMWRKTRTPYGSCFGADPNRNWDIHWATVGTSNNPCSDTYAGPKAFSEIETKSLADYMATLKIALHISFHAYSQLLLYPYGYTSQPAANVADYRKVYNAAVSAMGKRYNTKYTGGSIYEAIYPASGSSVDYTYDKLKVPMAFCYELRPSSNAVFTGFKLPADQIIPTGEETLDSITAMVSAIEQL